MRRDVEGNCCVENALSELSPKIMNLIGVLCQMTSRTFLVHLAVKSQAFTRGCGWNFFHITIKWIPQALRGSCHYYHWIKCTHRSGRYPTTFCCIFHLNPLLVLATIPTGTKKTPYLWTTLSWTTGCGLRIIIWEVLFSSPTKGKAWTHKKWDVTFLCHIWEIDCYNWCKNLAHDL